MPRLAISNAAIYRFVGACCLCVTSAAFAADNNAAAATRAHACVAAYQQPASKPESAQRNVPPPCLELQSSLNLRNPPRLEAALDIEATFAPEVNTAPASQAATPGTNSDSPSRLDPATAVQLSAHHVYPVRKLSWLEQKWQAIKRWLAGDPSKSDSHWLRNFAAAIAFLASLFPSWLAKGLSWGLLLAIIGWIIYLLVRNLNFQWLFNKRRNDQRVQPTLPATRRNALSTSAPLEPGKLLDWLLAQLTLRLPADRHHASVSVLTNREVTHWIPLGLQARYLNLLAALEPAVYGGRTITEQQTHPLAQEAMDWLKAYDDSRNTLPSASTPRNSA